ncbi:acylneuraminate cytidylyltransferase family protein [Shewanella xiamenensis]|uniref:acylneuraminate cytidylyltransferase family protein n=1 Tax=Shewanella xiamenensis TaxID=332186 RepID=UPI0035B8F0DB
MSKILALIPARGGSKRLKGKNILPFLGKPLIAQSVEVAKACPLVTSVVVSTDTEDIAEVARKYGASVPFLRPAELSTDKASSLDVVLHAINFLEKQGENYDLLLLLQPTSPLRTVEDIALAIKQYKNKNADGVISVTECEHSPLWSNVLPENMQLDNFISDEIINRRSQDLPTYYRLNGAIYLYSVEELKRRESFFYSPNVYAYVMPNERSIDIDNKLDFDFAEFIASKNV